MQQLAHRLRGLGTETAFSVADAAATRKSRGYCVLPFHRGDLSIPTAPHIVEATNRATADGYPGYCPGLGIPQLHEALVEELGTGSAKSAGPANIRRAKEHVRPVRLPEGQHSATFSSRTP